jgi:predicted RNA-binding Zn-ribbon protein involved in translation (DUF1610 family)
MPAERPLGKNIRCSSCGYELVGIEYFTGDPTKKSPTRTVEFFCPKCKNVVTIA